MKCQAGERVTAGVARMWVNWPCNKMVVGLIPRKDTALLYPEKKT